jgi:hypothetical protein
MFEFVYDRGKVFATLPRISYEDGYCSFEGEFFARPLFSIHSSEDVDTELVRPLLQLYRQPAAAT